MDCWLCACGRTFPNRIVPSETSPVNCSCGRRISARGDAVPCVARERRYVYPRGVGTQLKQLLSWWGHVSDGRCECDERAYEMDILGVEWCRANRPTIRGWLKEEAERRGVSWLVAEVGAFAALEAAILAATFSRETTPAP